MGIGIGIGIVCGGGCYTTPVSGRKSVACISNSVFIQKANSPTSCTKHCWKRTPATPFPAREVCTPCRMPPLKNHGWFWTHRSTTARWLGGTIFPRWSGTRWAKVEKVSVSVIFFFFFFTRVTVYGREIETGFWKVLTFSTYFIFPTRTSHEQSWCFAPTKR